MDLNIVFTSDGEIRNDAAPHSFVEGLYQAIHGPHPKGWQPIPAAGLASAPAAELDDLFRLYGASRRDTLFLLRLQAALPYFLAGLRISGGWRW